MNFLSALAPRHLGALLSVACIGGAMIVSTTQQAPVGRVQGRAVLGDTQKPLAHVKITLTSGAEFNDEGDSGQGDSSQGDSSQNDGASEKVRRYRTVTDAGGRFEIQGVDAGLYHLSATSRAHSSDEESLLVREDELLDVPLKLSRSQPELQLTQRQREFLPTQSVILPLHGYVDGAKAPGTDTLRVRVFRARLADILRDTKATEALGKVSNRYEPIATLPAALLHPGGAAPKLVETRVVPLKGADVEGFYHQRLKLEHLSAGLYLVDVTHGNSANGNSANGNSSNGNSANGERSVCAQVLVSDTALVVKKTRGELLAYAVDSQSGAPRAGAAIQVFQGGASLAKARTNGQGIAKISLPAGREGGDRMLTLASFGRSEATVGQYDSEGESDEKRGGFTVHAYTDRPIYRPGDRVAFKGIARRESEAGGGKRYEVPTGEAVDVEVRDEGGSRVADSHLKTNNYGSFHGDFELSSETPSGTYSIVMTLAGEEHTADFTVASYRKPEFSAAVVSNEKHYAFGDQVEMMVTGTYYFGAPVAGAKVHYTVLRAPDWSSLYAEETDADNTDADNEDAEEGGYADNSGEMVDEGDATLDANGHAVVRFDADKSDESEGDGATGAGFEEPQDQIYTVDVTMTDAAQREVEASGEALVTAGDFRLSAQTDGYFALPNQKTGMSVKAQDFNGKPLAGKSIVLSGTYSPDSTKNEAADSKTSPKPALKLEATTGANGIARISFTPPREGVLYLSAQGRDAQNREILATSSLWVSGEQGGDYDAQYNALALLTDKKRYRAGETARVLINAEERGGTALLTLEGSKLFREWLVPLRHHSTAMRVPLGKDYGPNVTLAVCMVRDGKFASSQAPLRVEVPERAIKVAVASNKAKYQPGERVTYNLQTSDFAGKPVAADLSFGVVDEAIYALQSDDAGALRRAFYPANPNDVETNYSFEPLYLGDVSKSEVNIQARRKFVDTAFWQSDIETDAKGRASVSFDLPDNLTTWRATATAQTLGSAFGRRTQKLTVAKDFFVRLDTPRFFTGGDSAQITALVHNDTGQNQSATLQIDAQGLGLQGANSQTVEVASGAVGQVVWPVSTEAAGLDFAGLARLKLSGWTSGNKKWTDALETSVPIRPHGRERIDNFVGNVQSSGAALTQKISLDPGAVASASQVTVRVTPSISDSLVGAVRYLTGFPYGCTEQTMSRFLPDILVQRTLRLRGARDKEAQKLAKELPKMVRDSVTRLGRFQHESGGWGWWENDDDDAWMTAYVIYGLSQARAQGYEVDGDMLAKGREAALKMLGKPNKKLPAWQQRNWENTRAFSLYALASASPSAKELNAIRAQRAALSTDELGSQALGYLVLLDKKLGLPNTVWPQLESQLQSEGDQLLFWEGDGHDEWADWNDKTATAVGLRALISHDPNDKRIPSVLLYLMAHRQDDAWGNTRDTSWVLSALCDYLDAQPKYAEVIAAVPGSLQIGLNGKTLQQYDLTPAASQGELVLRIPPQKLRASGNVLTLQRTKSGEPIFYAIQVRQTLGDDKPLPAVTAAIPIVVTREYRRLLPLAKGQNGWDLGSEATSGALQQGDRIRVRLTFETPRDLSYVLIEDAFPSGCETSERGSAEEGNEEWDNWWSSTDVRDDRIAFFARRMSRGKHTIEYNLRAQTRGAYSALPALLQAMYAPEVRAESAESRVQIK